MLLWIIASPRYADGAAAGLQVMFNISQRGVLWAG